MRYFQFIGTQRSGSNLLRLMLDQLPEISAPHPPHILKTFFPLLSRYGDLQREKNYLSLVEDICNWVNLNPVPWAPFEAQPEEIIKLCKSRDLISIFMAIGKAKAIYDGATIMCCKSMESVSYIADLEKSGYNPIYIYLYRDGRDVALSFMKAIVGSKHIFNLANKWKSDQIEALNAKKYIPADRFIALSYEELILNPTDTLTNLCLSLGLSFSPAMLKYFEAKESEKTARAGKMWVNLKEPVISTNHQKFLTGLSPAQILLFESVAGDVLEILGYKLVNKKSDLRSDFTASEINGFEEENLRLVEEALKTADPNDLNRRRPQSEFLKSIMSRNEII